MKKFYIIAIIITVLYAGFNVTFDMVYPTRDIEPSSIAEIVEETYTQPELRSVKTTNIDKKLTDEKLPTVQFLSENNNSGLSVEDELIICIAYVENFYSQSYFCGARWTIGYGSTIYANGSRVQSGEHISMLAAQNCARTHLRRRVFPYINKYVKRELSRAEIIGTSLFIYNVGAGNFASSAFLKAVNRGEDPVECVRRMTEFTKSAGKEAPGLLKREWVQGAIYCGYITPYDLLELKPAGFYNYGVDEYYSGNHRSWDGYYNPKYSSNDIKKFLHKNRGTSRRVIDII